MNRPLFWHQGLFLQPQHFQLQDAHVQAQLGLERSLGKPHAWGVVELDLADAALPTGRFSLNSGRFLFPDGTWAIFPGNAVIESRVFTGAWVEGGKPFTVYLGLKRWDPAGENVTLVERFEGLAAVSKRAIAAKDPEPVPDLHAAGPEGSVQRLHYLVKIFWETELDRVGDYLLIPIAQLERFGDEVRRSERFVPPAVSVRAVPLLHALIKDIRDQLTARCHQLEAFKTQKGVQTAEFGSRDMVYLLALRSLNRYVPLIAHLLDDPGLHPWTIFGVLRQVIGELSAFSEQVNVLGELEDGRTGLEAYDHSRLWPCFSSAQKLITRLLDDITAGPEYTLPLRFDGTYYATDLEPVMLEGRNRYFLVFRSEADPKEVLRSVATVTKLSAREFLPILIARALPGIDLEHLPVPPQELPRRAHCIYFQINHRNEQWNTVAKNRNLALYWDNAPEDLSAELMIVGRG